MGKPSHVSAWAWLQVATKGLSDESRARICEEITAHFHDAIDKGLRAGLSEDAAAEKAIESLGSARAARRALRRTYLTRRQQSTLKQYGEPDRFVSAAFGIMTMMVVWQAVLIEPRWMEPGWTLRIIATVGMALALTVHALLNPRIFQQGAHRTAFLSGVCANFVWWSCMMIAITGTLTGLWWLAPVALAAIPSYAPLMRTLHNRPQPT